MPCDFIAFWLEINLEHFFGVCFGCERIGEMSFVINTFLSLLLPSTGWHHIAIAIAMQLIRFQRKISENHIALYSLISTTFCELQHNRNALPVATTCVIPFMCVTNIKSKTRHWPQWKKNDCNDQCADRVLSLATEPPKRDKFWIEKGRESFGNSK